MTATAKITVVKVEDHEGMGTCSACGREGLRWVATLSDGSTVGSECAKKIMGWKIDVKKYQWTKNFKPVAEHNDCGTVFMLWQHKTGTNTAMTQNGYLIQMGGAREDWERKGWVV